MGLPRVNLTPCLFLKPRWSRQLETTVLDPASEFPSHTVMKPATQPASFLQKRPTVSNFYTKEMPIHRPASGFLKHTARNWPKSRLEFLIRSF